MTPRVEEPSPLQRAVVSDLGRVRSRGAPPWLSPLRERAADWFLAHGFPARKDEAWRFTSVRGLIRLPFPGATAAAPRELPFEEGAASVFATGRAHRVELLDGHPRPLDPLQTAGADVQIVSLADGVRDGLAPVRAHLGQHAAAEHAFAAVNTALFEDGAFIRVPAGVTAALPVELTVASRTGAAPSVAHARVLVVLERDAQLELLESHLAVGTGAAPFLATSVIEIVLGEGARLEHVRLLRGTPGAHRVEVVAVSQGRGSQYTSRVFTFGGALSRLDLNVRLCGEEARARLEGLYVARGLEHVDHHTVVDHAVPRCASDQRYRGIVDDAGHAVFDGTVLVRPGAQGTDAHQENHNLVMSRRAEVNSKPHLEIEHDDVRCSHGASVGRLDEEQVFYLRSRGLSEQDARGLVAEGFASAMVERIGDTVLRAVVRGELLARLATGGGSRC